MKKVVNIILTVLFVLLLGLTVYRGYIYLSTNKKIIALKEKTEELRASKEEDAKTLSELQNQADSLKVSNEDLYKEYALWQRHNQELKDILAGH